VSGIAFTSPITNEFVCVADAVADGAGSNLEIRTSAKEIGPFGYDSRVEFDYPLHSLQRHFVSNAVSNAKEPANAMANLSGQKVLRFGEIRKSESTGEQEIWA
jgi:hypothetical protein